MKRAAIPLLTGLVLVTLTIVAPAAVSVDKLLTVADVETATGRAGVRAIPRDPSKGAGGDLNFADARGEILVMIQVVEAKYYPEFKKAYFTAALAGVGDEAFTGASGPFDGQAGPEPGPGGGSGQGRRFANVARSLRETAEVSLPGARARRTGVCLP
jgi:hypothetical protein